MIGLNPRGKYSVERYRRSYCKRDPKRWKRGWALLPRTHTYLQLQHRPSCMALCLDRPKQRKPTYGASGISTAVPGIRLVMCSTLDQSFDEGISYTHYVSRPTDSRLKQDDPLQYNGLLRISTCYQPRPQQGYATGAAIRRRGARAAPTMA
jgi:hypothetical protein